MSVGEKVFTIARAAYDTFQAAMQQSYDKGKKEGYAEGYDAGFAAAQKEIMAMVSGIGKRYSGEGIENIRVPSRAITLDDERAAPGTVKPAILKLIKEHPDGLSKSQIVNLTGIKPNSVRGTLWSLNQEGVIGKGGRDLWIPIESSEQTDNCEDLLGP